jgi:CBS domain-containing protein
LLLEKIGYELCPNGHMATMLWCKSLTDWIQYDSWMNSGENSNNLSSIFFDYELVLANQN